jgi:hypothetical protein
LRPDEAEIVDHVGVTEPSLEGWDAVAPVIFHPEAASLEDLTVTAVVVEHHKRL